MIIEPVNNQNFEALLDLIGEYQRFYEIEPNREKNALFFKRILDSDGASGLQFIMKDEKGVYAGFATLYFPFSSCQAGQYCLMNDLYVRSEFRGKGYGKALLNCCADVAKSRGFSQIVWQTAESNTSAQRIYDATGAKKSNWIEYSLPVEKRLS